MKRVLWLIPLLNIACQAQKPPVVTSVRGTYVLYKPFTIVTIEQPVWARVRCADKEDQKTFADMRDLAEIMFNYRMLQPWEYYGISGSECACEGIVGFAVESRSTEVIVHCRKGG